MRTPLLCLVAFAGSVVAAPVPKAVKVTDDAKALDGRWVRVTLDSGAGPKADDSQTIMIKDGTVAAKGDTAAVAFTLDATQSPKQLNVLWKSWKNPAPYIYELDGDTLRWCHAQEGQPRPTEFKGGGPGGQMCSVWKRVKE